MARSFNGSSDKLLAGSAALGAPPATMAAWVIPSSTAAEVNIAGPSSSASGTPLYRILMTGAKASAQYRDDAGAISQSTGTTSLSTSVFNHICGTFNSSFRTQAFFNGVAEGSLGGAGANGTITLDQTDIGVLQRSSAGQFWPGVIAEVAFWNVELTQAEITALALGKSPLLIRPSARVLYTPLVNGIVDYHGRAFTTTGTTASAHPRVFNPKKRQPFSVTAAGGGTTPVQQDATLLWSLLNLVQQDSDLRWGILNAIQQDATLKWNIVNAAQQDSTLLWSILNAAQQDTDLRWAIIAAVQQDATLIWNVAAQAGTVQNDTTLVWNLANAVFQQLEADWNILSAVQCDTDLRWQIANAVAQDLTARWGVLTAAQQDLTLKWNLIGVAENTLTLRWTIASESARVPVTVLVYPESHRVLVLNEVQRTLVLPEQHRTLLLH